MDTAGSDSPDAATEPQPGPGARRGQRLQRRTEPGRSGLRAGRRSSGGRGGDFLCPSLFRPSESVRLRLEEEPRPRRHQGVLSDSENEEPISRRIRTISAFIRKTSTALSRGGQRSRSCTDPLENSGKMKVLLQPALLDPVGALTAGVLLSSENSRSVSVPILPPQRRLAWSAVVPPPRAQRGGGARPERPAPPGRSERSASPDSNDSISEELNHFKPIVCSPCTPPRRSEDGRLLPPPIVKATPRNLRELPQTSQGTWFSTSAAVLQKLHQIELDRQTVSTSTGGVGGRTVTVATHTSPENDSTPNPRRVPPLTHEETVRIRVPAIRPHDHSPDGLRFGSKRKQNSKRVVAKRSRRDDDVANSNSCVDANSYGKYSGMASASLSAQERADRVLALTLQRRFDAENADTYFLRSTTQSTAPSERGQGLRSTETNRSTERRRSLRSSQRNLKRP